MRRNFKPIELEDISVNTIKATTDGGRVFMIRFNYCMSVYAEELLNDGSYCMGKKSQEITEKLKWCIING